MQWFKFAVYLLVVVAVLVLIVYLFIFYKNDSYSPKGKFSVVLAGRSTTDLWFKYWNLPRVLNRISVWRNWYIPYEKYVQDGFYLQDLQIPSPQKGKDQAGFEYGKYVFETISDFINKNNFNALSFKFCFVDFDDSAVNTHDRLEKRFNEMSTLVTKIHDLTSTRKMKLILYTALPAFAPQPLAQELRFRFNNWLNEYAQQQSDIMVVDLYSKLTDQQGRLRNEYSVDPADSDSHVNMQAHKIISKELFTKLAQLQSTTVER